MTTCAKITHSIRLMLKHSEPTRSFRHKVAVMLWTYRREFGRGYARHMRDFINAEQERQINDWVKDGMREFHSRSA